MKAPELPRASKLTVSADAGHTYHHLYKLHVAGLRFFTVYGPRGRPDMAPFKFMDRVYRGLEIQQFGDGSSSRDYTYIDDIVDGVIRALDRPNGYQIYNLGNGNPVGLRRFIRLVEKETGKQANIVMLPEQPGDVPRTAANISKAQMMLGYKPVVSFDQGIHRLAEWYRKDYVKLMNKFEQSIDESTWGTGMNLRVALVVAAFGFICFLYNRELRKIIGQVLGMAAERRLARMS